MGGGRRGVTFLEVLLAAAMRDVMLVRFSASCFARWGFICKVSAIVGTRGGKIAKEEKGRKIFSLNYDLLAHPNFWS